MNNRRLMAIVLALLCSWLPGVAAGQTLLRWKLKPQESLLVQTQQQTESQVTFGGKSVTTKIDLAVELLWSVTAATDKEMTVLEKFRRIQIKIESPQAGTIQFDSAASTKPTGQARNLADGLKPFLAAEFEIKMTDRGEILATKAANKPAEEILAGGGQDDDQAKASHQAIQQLLGQSLIILPEKAVAEGENWTHESDVKASAGNFHQTTTYRMAGTMSRGNESLLKIEMQAQLSPAAQSGGGAVSGSTPLTVKSHEQSGTILFSADSGRVVEVEQKQKLITERPYRDTTIVVSLSSTTQITIQPATP